MKKRFTSVLLSVTLLLSSVPITVSAADLPFTDIPANAWYKNAVTYAYENGLLNGTGETTFSPNAAMTRGMFVQVLANKTSNYNKADYEGKSSFSDVSAKKYYAPAIEWASKAGLVDGVGNGKFDPDKNVSREQMAKIMYSYAQKTGNDASLKDDALAEFPDASTVASWAKEPMKWAVTHGVINGSDGKINPKSSAKRCEVATVVANADPVLVKTEVEVGEEPGPGPAPSPSPAPDPSPSPDPDKALTYQEFKDLFPVFDGAGYVCINYKSDDTFTDEEKLAMIKRTGKKLVLEYGVRWIKELEGENKYPVSETKPQSHDICLYITTTRFPDNKVIRIAVDLTTRESRYDGLSSGIFD